MLFILSCTWDKEEVIVEKNTDARVVRTKKAIRLALMELIEEKGFEAITVKDIATKAEINRGTFYVHYEDKHDLMNECQTDIMQGMSDIAKQKLQNVVVKGSNQSKPATPSPAVTIFEYLDENKVMMKALLGQKGDLSFQTALRDFLWKTLFEDKEQNFFKKENLLVPEEYLASYIAFAHIGVIQQWLENGGTETPREMAQILSSINIHGPFVAAGLKK